MNDDYKSLKVPTWVYNNVVDAQHDVLRRGLDALPADVLKPRHCPRCQHEVKFVEATAEVKFASIACTHCEYRQQTISLEGQVVAGVGLGVLLGFGLYYLIDKMNEPPPKKRAKKRAVTKRTRRRG